MSDDILRAILAGNPAMENTFASEQLQMQDQLRRQQEAEMIAAQEAGLYGSAGVTPNVNMHGEVLEAAGETPPGQWLTGAVDRTMQPIFDPRDLEPYVNSQGKVVQPSTGMPAPWVTGVGGRGGAANLRGAMTAGQRAKLAQQKLHAGREVKKATRFFEGLPETPPPAPGRPGVRLKTPDTLEFPHATAELDRVLGDVVKRAGPGARVTEAERLADAAKRASEIGDRAMSRAARIRNKGVIPGVYNATDELARIAPAEAAREAARLRQIASKLANRKEAAALNKLAGTIDDAVQRADVLRLPPPGKDTIEKLKAIIEKQGKTVPPNPKGIMHPEEYDAFLRKVINDWGPNRLPRGGDLGWRPTSPMPGMTSVGPGGGYRAPSAAWAAEIQAARKLLHDRILVGAGSLGIGAGVIGIIASLFKEDDDSELPTSTVKAAEGMMDNSGDLLINPETKKGAPDLIPGAVEDTELPGTIEGKQKTGKRKHHLFVAQEHRDKVNNLHINAPHGERVPLEDLHVQVPDSVRNKEALYRKAFYTNGIVTHNPSHPNSYIVVDPRTWRPTTYGPGDARRAKSDERKRQNERNIMNNPDKYRPIFMKQARKSMSGAYRDAMKKGDKQTAAMLYHNTKDKDHPLVKLATGAFMKPGEVVHNRRTGAASRLPSSVDRAAFLEYQTKYDARFDKDRDLTPAEVLIQGWTRQGNAYKAEMSDIHSRLAGLEAALGAAAMETEQYKGLLQERADLQTLGLEKQAELEKLNLREERPGEQLHDYLPSHAKLLPEFQDRATPGKHGGASLLNANAEDRRRRMVDMMEPYFKKELADPKSRVRIPREFSTGVYGIDYAPKPGADAPALQDKGNVPVPLQVTEGTRKVTITNRNIFEQANKLGEGNNIPQAVANVQAILEYVKSNPDAIDEIETNVKSSWEEFIRDKMHTPIKDKKGKKKGERKTIAYDIPEINQALNELYMLGTGRKETHPEILRREALRKDPANSPHRHFPGM